MALDHDVCYGAIKIRDPRFDGRFFTGVHTTGIYCRPICPARLPAQKNVSFYACAAAAEEAGFRACRRCRPESSPGTPAWMGTSATVSRAMRLIAEGALDRDGSIEQLADRLGVTARHLRRLFEDHLGASPVSIAQSRRVHFAKRLLDTTALPITEIALSSGFSSIRRFNAVFLKAFDRSPRQVRDRQSRQARALNEPGLTLAIAFRAPFDWNAMLEFLRLRAIPGIEHIADGHYRRSVSLFGESGVIDVSLSDSQNQLSLLLPPVLARHALPIADRVRRLFDLSADSRIIEEHLSRDATLRHVVARHSGTRVPGAWNPFEISVRAILGQQVSVKGATTLAGRLVESYGTPISGGDARCNRILPTPEKLARVRCERIGLTRGRAEALRSLAKAVVRKDVLLDGAEDLDATIERLLVVPGIGPWTAHYIAMRASGEPNAFPAGDLALRKVATLLDPKVDSQTALERRSETWKPWRAYAAMFMWRAYSDSLEAGTRKKVQKAKRGIGNENSIPLHR